MIWLDTLANVAAIVTALVAVVAYGSYLLTLRARTRAVESLLKAKNKSGDDSLRLDQIAGELALTVEQVLEAASKSKRIKGTTGPHGTERRLRYVGASN